jgi:hypothetical protein
VTDVEHRANQAEKDLVTDLDVDVVKDVDVEKDVDVVVDVDVDVVDVVVMVIRKNGFPSPNLVVL